MVRVVTARLLLCCPLQLVIACILMLCHCVNIQLWNTLAPLIILSWINHFIGSYEIVTFKYYHSFFGILFQRWIFPHQLEWYTLPLERLGKCLVISFYYQFQSKDLLNSHLQWSKCIFLSFPSLFGVSLWTHRSLCI